MRKSASKPHRRELLTRAIAGASGIALWSCTSVPPDSSDKAAKSDTMKQKAQAPEPHILPPLPYADGALSPVISANTIGFHYGKHHKAYVDNLNGLLKDTADLAALSLDELVKKTAGDTARAPIFNNAAQVWNHTFYWNSMHPKGGGAPTGRMLDRVRAAFGDYVAFKEAFGAAAKAQFGSGWVWLVANGQKLSIEKTGNADTPMARGQKCLLTCDVWEHAYYLDYQNQRNVYVTEFLDKLVNWEFAEQNLG